MLRFIRCVAKGLVDVMANVFRNAKVRHHDERNSKKTSKFKDLRCRKTEAAVRFKSFSAYDQENVKLHLNAS